MMQELFRKDPQARIRYETTKRMLDDKVREYLQSPNGAQYRTSAVVNIPVVVHIMYSNPNQVTDALVQRQIDTLNRYYGDAPSGDSLRVFGPFTTSYGRSDIRFCLAQRTETNIATTGIERVTTSNTYTASSASGHPSATVAAWDPRKYLNIWVVQFTDQTLGYSYLPGTWGVGDPHNGFVVDYRAFGSNASYLYSTYNGGKTAVHEIGHFFNLQHPWGPGGSNSTCAQDDGCSDTPPTNGPTFNCPTGPVLNTCTTASPGIMWQNHMDYADDRCMILFTAQQVAKMNVAVTSSPDRNTLPASNGCLAVPTTPAGDIQLLSINTPGSLLCSGGLTPNVTVRNLTSAVITGLKISYSIDNGPAQTVAFTNQNLFITAQQTYQLTTTSISDPGVHTIRIYTWDPESVTGFGDINKLNDTLVKQFAITGSVQAPLSESFLTATFPPSNWAVTNADGSITWTRNGNGKDNAGSAFVNTFNYASVGQSDYLISPSVNYTNVDSVTLSFDVAAASFRTAGPADTLEVLITRDCGNSFTSVYKKAGNDLRTTTAQASEFFPLSGNQWRKEFINISQFAASSPIMVMFRTANTKENNIFIDNINLNTATLPAALKEQGYLIAPTVTRNNFSVLSFQQAPNLKYINVYNSVGQLVWSKQYSGNASNNEVVDIFNQAAGLYIVKLGYTDESRNVSQKVIKQ
jgi:hypothetical protein